ncbi:MAG: hypothetical protein KC516_01640 [Nanoarchaeota archaeon]|nr:hypothetical protein [Nanoarchaeota archaeon]
MAKLFSIKEKYSKKIFSKEKLVEFRRQNVHISRKEICLIYTSFPVKKIEGHFIVEEKIRLPIQELWNKTKEIAGISFKEFMNYFEGCEVGTAILFKSVKKIKKTWSLEDLKKIFGDSFRPPQSYYNLEGKLSKLVEITA